MSIDHAANCNGFSPIFNARCVGSRFTKVLIFSGCLVVNFVSMTRIAFAHVKWFVPCTVSDDPLPVQAAFTTTFFLFSALFLALFYLACAAEQTEFGAMFSRFLDRVTEPLRHRVDDLLRAAAAVFFALLWAQGGANSHPRTQSKQYLALSYSVVHPPFFERAGHTSGSGGRYAAALWLWCR